MTTLRGGFVSLRAAAAESKQWNLIFPRGEWHGANLEPIGGSITIDDGMLAEVVANWQAAGKPPLPVRVTHSHLDETDPVKRLELEKAVGLLTDFRVTADGLEALTEWNPAGASAVRQGEWNFWSPEWQPKHLDRRTGETRGWWLSGVALTNDPFFNTMPAVAASTAIPPGSPTGNQLKGQQMNPLAKVAAALGMPEDSTEEAVCAECMKLKAGGQPPPMAPPMMQASIDKAIEPLRAQLKAATDEVATLKAEKVKAAEELFKRDVDGLIASAMAEGYACEPLREAITLVAQAKGLEAAKAVAQSASKLPLSTTGTPGVRASAPTGPSASDYDAALEKYSREKGLAGAAAVKAFHRDNPEMAKALVASIPAAPTTR